MRELSEKLAKLDDDALNRLYMRVFNTPDGELLLEDLRVRCSCYDTTLDKDSILMAWKEGMRAVVLTIETRLASKPAEPKEE